MKMILDKIIFPLIIVTILGAFNSWLQIKENQNRIISLLSRVEKIEDTTEALSDYYVTRREFNRILEMQNEKMDTINKNVEKLIDLQLKNK